MNLYTFTMELTDQGHYLVCVAKGNPIATMVTVDVFAPNAEQAEASVRALAMADYSVVDINDWSAE